MSEDRTIISFDYAIKTVLRDKANFDVLEGFLSELMRRDVKVIDIIESEGNKDDETLKTNRVDLKARIDDADMVIFEIQFFTQVDFFGKLLFDVSKAVVEQVSVGKQYDIKKIYMIGIAYFNLHAERDYLFRARLSGFEGVHFDDVIPFSQARGLAPGGPVIDIHPEYYLILPNMFNEDIRSKFDEWIYTLKTSIVRSDFTAAGLREASDKLNMLKMDEKERRIYEKYMRNMTDDSTVIETARMEGRVEGREEGKAEGRAEGEAKGRAEGVAEGLIQAAKAMKAKGMDIRTIAEITGLPENKIQRI